MLVRLYHYIDLRTKKESSFVAHYDLVLVFNIEKFDLCTVVEIIVLKNGFDL